MSDEEILPDEAEPTKKGTMPLLAGVLGILIGAGVGAMMLGPVAAPLFAGKGEASHKGEGEYASAPQAPTVHVIDNLVVNPAGSQGMRLLLTSIAVDVGDNSGLVDALDAVELDLRGRFLYVFGSRTVAELSDVALRDTLAMELQQIIEEVVGDSIRRVFLPQFVLQ